jgi:hypothetical protein
MPIPKQRTHKHFRLDPRKIKRAQRILKAKTETETIERALDLAIAHYPTSCLIAEANECFVGPRFANR